MELCKVKESSRLDRVCGSLGDCSGICRLMYLNRRAFSSEVRDTRTISFHVVGVVKMGHCRGKYPEACVAVIAPKNPSRGRRGFISGTILLSGAFEPSHFDGGTSVSVPISTGDTDFHLMCEVFEGLDTANVWLFGSSETSLSDGSEEFTAADLASVVVMPLMLSDS